MRKLRNIVLPCLVVAIFANGTFVQAAKTFKIETNTSIVSVDELKQDNTKIKYLSANIKNQLEQAKQAKVNIKDYDAFCNAIGYLNYEYVKKAVDAGIDVNVNACGSHMSPLLYATLTGDLSMVNLLVVSGADVNRKSWDNQDQTPLIAAAGNNHKRIAKYLVDNGADLDLQEKQGATALIMATYHQQVATFLYLISAGADVNKQDISGGTALMWAVSNDNQPMLEDLISAGADVNIQDEDGETALMSAIFKSVGIVKYLVEEAKADISLKNKEGKTALDIARENNYKYIADYLESKQ